MSKKLEQVLECLINEESDRASELLHDVIVEKARVIYQDLVNEEDDVDLDEEEDCTEEEDTIEEGFYAEDESEDEDYDAMGGDESDDFADDIEADLDTDEEDEFGAEEAPEEEEVEDRVEDLEAALADLRAEFDSLMGGEEASDPEQGEFDFGDEESDPEQGEFDFGDEESDPEMEESVYEGIQDTVAEPSNTEDAGDKKSMYTKAPSKKLDGADPIKGDTSEEAGCKADEGKDETPTDNVDVDHKAAPEGAAKKEGQTDSDAIFTKEVK